MADPKIKYDIEAAVKGEAEIADMAQRLEDMGKVIDKDLSPAAKAAAAEMRALGQQQAAIVTFAKLSDEVKKSEQSLALAQRSVKSFNTEISASGPPTTKQAATLARLNGEVQSSQTKLNAQKEALHGANQELLKYGLTGDRLIEGQRKTAEAVEKLKTKVVAIAPAWQSAAAAASVSAGKQVQATKQIEGGLDSLKNQLNSLRNVAVAALGGSYVGSLAKDVADTADSYNNLQARIKLATGETVAFTPVFQAVSEVAFRTNTALESTGNLFGKLTEAGKSSGQSTQAAIAQSLQLTETIGQAIQLSGASQQASDAAITQLIQGLQSGVLRGEEFNSVMEQSPRLAKALADGLGVTTGELRKMANAGQLTTDVVIKSLQGQADVVAAEFSKLPPTVGRAIQNLSSAWTIYVGETDKATGASSAAASAINLLSTNLKTVAGFLLDAGQAAAALVAIRLAQHFLGIGAAATQATTAVVANTAAVTAAGAAGNTAAIGVGRFASILSGLKTFTLLGLVTNFHDIGTAIGEAAAKLMGYKDRTQELIELDKQAALAAAENAKYRQKVSDANEAARESQLGLTKATKAATLEFDALVAKGNTAAEAIAKIGKDFDLSKSAGIRDAGVLLNNLAATGKLTAAEFKQAWSDALKGINLAEFEVKAQKAFGSSTDGVLRLKQALDATLREAIKRTGLDFDVISGGMSKASVSAIDDTGLIIKGLERLKAMGVDTAQALTASIGKSIDTADTQKALDTVRSQIEAVRKALGDKVADGLLDQAAQKALALGDALDKAKPGINSVREAMKELGVVTDQTLKIAAEKSKTAYDTMRNSGLSSARELADGFKKYAEAAIAANGGVASEALKSEAAMRGLEVQTDATGKAIVRAMGEGKRSTDDFTGSVRAASSAVEDQNAALEKSISSREKALDLKKREEDLAYEELWGETKKDSEGRTINMSPSFDTVAEAELYKKQRDENNLRNGVGGVSQAAQMVNSMFESEFKAELQAAYNKELTGFVTAAVSQGMSAVSAEQIARDYMTRRSNGYNPGTFSDFMETATAKRTTPQPPNTRSGGTGKTYTVNVNLGGTTTAINTSSDADAQALINVLKRAQLSA